MANVGSRFENLLLANAAWARGVTTIDPDFFKNSAKEKQKPHVGFWFFYAANDRSVEHSRPFGLVAPILGFLNLSSLPLVRATFLCTETSLSKAPF